MTDLYLDVPALPWTFDATAAGIQSSDLRALPWAAAFRELRDLEGGGIANPDEHRQVGHYWLRDASLAPTVDQATGIGDAIEACRALAASIVDGSRRTEADEAFTDVLHVGIGGSQLGPAVLIDALSRDGRGTLRGLPIHFLDNTDPDGIASVLGHLGSRLRTTLVVVVTKSGSTSETMNAMALTHAALRAAGCRPGAHTVGITVDGSKLHQRAADEAWIGTLPIWDWVGGRWSVTAAVGLFPAMLAGLDADELLRGAREMDAWTRHDDPLANPAAVLAGVWHLRGHGRGDRNLVVLPYADRLLLLSRYLQQVIMESIGQRLDRQGATVHQGITVYGNKGSTDQHAFVQQLRDGRDDAIVLFLQALTSDAHDPALDDDVTAGDYLQGFLIGTRRALAQAGRPSLTLTIPKVDERTLGGVIALFERAVSLYASLVDINAYHQPGVEAGKRAAKAILGLSGDLRAAIAERPATTEDLAARFGADPIEVRYVLRRLALTARLTEGPDGRWHAP